MASFYHQPSHVLRFRQSLAFFEQCLTGESGSDTLAVPPAGQSQQQADYGQYREDPSAYQQLAAYAGLEPALDDAVDMGAAAAVNGNGQLEQHLIHQQHSVAEPMEEEVDDPHAGADGW